MAFGFVFVQTALKALLCAIQSLIDGAGQTRHFAANALQGVRLALFGGAKPGLSLRQRALKPRAIRAL